MEYTKVNKCGCKVSVDKHGNTIWEYCNKHGATDDLYEACVKAMKHLLSQGMDNSGASEVYIKLNVAVCKAEGK